MVNPRELRIGNYVSTSLHRFARITDISTDGCKVDLSVFMSAGREMITNSDDYILNKYIAPIPLTEDILLKCGFKNMEYKLGVKDGHIILGYEMNICKYFLLEYNPIHSFYFIECNTMQPITSLHQLQNIIFDLYGKELEVKL